MDDSHVSEESDGSELYDRFGELPDSLIHQILSLLPTISVVQTSLLSKRWKNRWTTIPFLDFCGDPERRDQFRNFVNRALAHWNGTKILKFNMKLMFEQSFTSDVDSWLLFAIEKQVEELHVDLLSCSDVAFFEKLWKGNYCLPQRLYSCSSIRNLSLVSCILEIEGNVQWNKLESLKIEVRIPFSANAINQILCGAPRLEVLDLRIPDASENLNIESGSLKRLKIWYFVSRGADEANDSMLRVWAPNLESLEISGVPRRRCLLNVPSLTNAILGSCDGRSSETAPYYSDILLEEMLSQVLLSVHHVEKITLTYWCIKVLFEMKKRDMAVSFSHAKFVKFYVDTADEILDVIEMFPKLTTLVVESTESTDLIDLLMDDFIMHQFPNIADEEPSEMMLDSSSYSAELRSKLHCPSLPHLRTVEISSYLPDDSIIPVTEIMLENAHVLEKMVLQPSGCDDEPELLALIEEKVLSMPRSSPTARVFVCRDAGQLPDYMDSLSFLPWPVLKFSY